jgi:RNA polymerase sigma-70 factor (ECF subfamily)
MSSIHLVTIDDNSLELVDTYRPDLEMERKELMFKFDRAIETLPHQCKIVFRLVKEDGMKCREVADILQISTRTVHTQLYRAMKKLSSIMVDYENHPKKEGSSIASKIFSIFFL